MGRATKSIRGGFDRRRAREAEHPRLARSGGDTGVPLLGCGRVSPGSYSRDLFTLFSWWNSVELKTHPRDYCFQLPTPNSVHLILSTIAKPFQSAGAQLPLSFIPSYTVVLGLTASKGANLLAASNAINAASRVLTGYAGDRLGRQNTLLLTMFLAVLSVFSFWLTSVLATTTATSSSLSLSLWVAFIALYSFSIGGYYALFPAFIAEVFGIRQYAAVNAFILFVRGLGTMFGSPVGGRLLGSSEEGTRAYASIAYWDGALLVGATVCCVGVRWADGKGKGWKWIA